MQHIPWSSKILFCFWIEAYFFLIWSYWQHFFVDVHNIVSTLIWSYATSQRHINLKATLNQRWNVCWVVINASAFGFTHLFFDLLSVGSVTHVLTRRKESHFDFHNRITKFGNPCKQACKQIFTSFSGTKLKVEFK